jgi:deazaflavin-dependent oxidoreductase (nitroreductase family)
MPLAADSFWAMGLAGDLSYVYPRPNKFHRAMQAFAATRPGAWLFSKTLARTDRIVGNLSQGGLSVPTVVARLPVLVLTTIGRKTGKPRTTHLIAVPFEDTLAVLGTNFGQASTPAWVLNLEAEPHATVTHAGVTCAVVARPATDGERRKILADASTVYRGYTNYQRRIAGRRLRIFVLEQSPAEPD